MKIRSTVGLALLATAASALSACGGDKLAPGTVRFWSSFGGAYTNVLNSICEEISTDTGLKIKHESQNNYDNINSNMISAIGPGDYPHIAMGYPDHFATYLSANILTALDDYFTEEEKNDYYSEYLEENYFYDNGRENAQKKLYGIPFNKSTELLGYNGTFVDYCASLGGKYEQYELDKVPASWSEWETKGPIYNEIFVNLMKNKQCVYGVQDYEGKASQFEVTNLVTTTDEDGDIALANGKKLLLDFSKADPNTAVLMSWDATDNAFITLVRQWGAEYTNLPDSEKVKAPKKRVGQVLFNSAANQPKVIDCLQFFTKLNKDRIFGTPTDLGGSYSSDAFANCKVMFMICSSGGLSYNTADWHHRFRVAPIPYKDANNKQVISQGANICLTDKGEIENSVKLIKALTTGKYQTEWCLQTGYYPCSKSALESTEYQTFISENKYYPDVAPVRVAYREGSKLNNDYYMSKTEGWKKFVDPAFKGSSEIRSVVKGVLDAVFNISDATDYDAFKNKLNELENASTIQGQSTIEFIH